MKDDWAVSLIRGLAEKRESLMRDKRATAAYWNCDDWGSISGHRDAQEWVEGELAKWVRERVSPRATPRKAKRAERKLFARGGRA